jgi:hypothetical protein
MDGLHFHRCRRTRQTDYQIEFLPSVLEQIRVLPKDARRLIGPCALDRFLNFRADKIPRWILGKQVFIPL